MLEDTRKCFQLVNQILRLTADYALSKFTVQHSILRFAAEPGIMSRRGAKSDNFHQLDLFNYGYYTSVLRYLQLHPSSESWSVISLGTLLKAG